MQAGNIKQHILADQDEGLTIILDESSDSAMDKLPMNVIIGTSKHGRAPWLQFGLQKMLPTL